MTNSTDKPTEAWTADDWLDADAEDTTTLHPDTTWTHRGDSIHDEVVAGRARRDAVHRVVTTLAELRRATGHTQVDVAEEWGRPQSKVSRLENDPTRAEIATLVGYVVAIGGHLAVEAEIDGETYRYELV
jgi:Helix-turn-helix domain